MVIARSEPNAIYLSGLSNGRAAFLLDATLVFVPLAAGLFNVLLGPLTVLLVFGSAVLLAWSRLDRMPAALFRSWPILLLPAFALLSLFWSQDPAATARYGTLYAITIAVGFMIGGCLDRSAVLIGAFASYSSFLIAGLVYGSSVNVGYGTGIVAFTGLAPSKNMAGSTAAIGLMLALTTAAWAITTRKLLLLLAALAMIAVAGWMLVAAQSTGSIIGGALAVFCMTLWLLSKRLSRQTRSAILVTFLIFVIALALLHDQWMPQIFDAVLAGSGKDAGLTGRVELWRKADELIARRPFAGAGFAAFWQPGNLDAEALWRQFMIDNRTGFNFHNTPREILVHMGWSGAVLYLTIGATALITLMMRAMLVPDAARIFFCAWMVYFVIRLPFESMGLAQMHPETILAAIAMTMAFAPELIGKFRAAAARS